MPKYLIERTVPGAGQMDTAALAAIATKSNDGPARPRPGRPVGPQLRDGRQAHLRLRGRHRGVVREHGRCGGFPMDAILTVHRVIDPTTAEQGR